MPKTRKAIAPIQLKDQQQQPDLMELQERQAREPDEPNVNTRTTAPADFIAYPMAMKILREKWQATPEELAVWVYLGPKIGGIAAYLNANELSPPPQFSFAAYIGREDYLSPLMSCWFHLKNIEQFEPADRYITGVKLIDRWRKYPDIQPRAFIKAKIVESRLIDLHPTFGGTITFDDKENFPPLETVLFGMSQIKRIEVEDLARHQESSVIVGGRPQSLLKEVIARLYLHFRETGNLTAIQPNNVRVFLKELKSYLNDDVQGGNPEIWKLRTYLAERIKEVIIPRNGSKCSVLTQDLHQGKNIVKGSRYDQDRISRFLSELRKKYPLPS